MSATSELSSLVNTNRVRSAIRRLFANDIGECFGELFQNSQRAGATAVSIRTFPDHFVYEDDGHGVNTVAGFHALLRLAESGYENPAVEDQHPMGLGIHSVLAHDRVTRVKFESGRLGLEVAAREWWDDPGYYQTWYERLEESAGAAVRGLRVTVFHHPDLAAKVTRTFTGDDYHVSNPARGYRGILKVRVNGAEVDTRLPRWARVRNPLVETAYDGAPLVIGFEGEGRDSSVNFYGQVIRCELAPAGGFAFHLDVRSGRPVKREVADAPGRHQGRRLRAARRLRQTESLRLSLRAGEPPDGQAGVGERLLRARPRGGALGPVLRRAARQPHGVSGQLPGSLRLRRAGGLLLLGAAAARRPGTERRPGRAEV
jgi:hypothetical protein